MGKPHPLIFMTLENYCEYAVNIAVIVAGLAFWFFTV